MDLEVAWGLQRVKDIDATLYIMAGDNASEMADVPASILEASRLAGEPLMDMYLSKKWVLLRFPTASAAQAAGMSTEGFEDFCLDVSTLDYARMDKAMDPLVDLMSRTDRVRITGPGTDLSFSDQRDPGAQGGRQEQHPRRRGVHRARAGLGERHHPLQHPFAGGRHHLRAGAAHLQGRPDRRRRRQRAGEAAARCSTPTRAPATWASSPWGSTRGSTGPMKDTLYDEKIGGSLHLTPGRAYEEADNGNRSSVHWDLVLIQTPRWGGGERKRSVGRCLRLNGHSGVTGRSCLLHLESLGHGARRGRGDLRRGARGSGRRAPCALGPGCYAGGAA